MEYKKTSSENFKPVRWSGGTTTELFIFPPTADYQKKVFEFRLSTSVVENEKSEFTILKGISRILMVLTGSITLKHENHHTKQLSEFETDEFKGDWTTTSFGKCTDFNLMTSGEAKGRLSALVVEKNKTISYRLEAIYNWLFIYAYSGKINLKIDTGSIELNKGDLLEMNKLAGQVIEINGIEKSNLVFAYIRT